MDPSPTSPPFFGSARVQPASKDHVNDSLLQPATGDKDGSNVPSTPFWENWRMHIIGEWTAIGIISALLLTMSYTTFSAPPACFDLPHTSPIVTAVISLLSGLSSIFSLTTFLLTTLLYTYVNKFDSEALIETFTRKFSVQIYLVNTFYILSAVTFAPMIVMVGACMYSTAIAVSLGGVMLLLAIFYLYSTWLMEVMRIECQQMKPPAPPLVLVHGTSGEQ